MKEKFLIGGYTKRESKGIYSVELDTDTATLSNLALVAEISGATYLTVDAHDHLYAVASENSEGGTTAFTFDGKKAEKLNSVTAPGASNCYVSVDEARNLVYAANYHLGEVRVYKRLSDGSLELTDVAKHEDHHGPKPEQKGALCHFANLTPDNRLAVCDLGNDAVYTYAVSADGKLSDAKIYHSQAGSGDRHITFSADGKHAYLACELDSTVEVLTYENGTFNLLQKITTLPDTHTGFNGVAAIRLSADGKFLYVSNRGNDSIVSYKVATDGASIETLGWASTEGNIPRDFNFNKSEDFILVAHQDSDNLTLFKRDQNSGALTLAQKDFYSPEGTCVFAL
ncbi:lactonase family protein [Lactococcus nasutitermitis]|uniref:Lactonase family protein n=1 Tax=Lactococcus nasutitermitis TaxID=1652957 RepID=A0ABV9JF03_9LACT|nr:lactonase family protein [Lactococcus nasutitermitis]